MFDDNELIETNDNLAPDSEEEAIGVEPTSIDPAPGEVSAPVSESSDNSTLPAVHQNTSLAPTSEDSTFDQIGSIIEQNAYSIASEAAARVNNPKKVDKHADELADAIDMQILNAIEAKKVQEKIKAARHLIDKKKLKNELYQIEQEGKRLRREEKHLNELQKARHKQEDYDTFWSTYESTLTNYDMKKGSSRVFCRIILALDGIKGFFNGIGKVSTAIVKALKFLLIGGTIFGILYAIPITRSWIQAIFGF